MHQRKLHLLALCENDLLEPWLNSTLSLWVSRNSLQWMVRCVLREAECSRPPPISPLLCLMKPGLEGSVEWASEQASIFLSMLEPISKIESRCHLLTPCFLTKCVQLQSCCERARWPSSPSPGGAGRHSVSTVFSWSHGAHSVWIIP